MMDFDRRRALLAAVIVLVAVGAVGAQTFLFTAGSGGTINATDGPAVTLGEGLGLTGGNPVNADGSVTIQDTTLDGPTGSTATLTGPSSSAPTLTSIDPAGGTLEADTSGIQTTGVDGSITELTYRDVDLASTATTFEVTGSGTLYVHGFSAGYWLRVHRASGDDTLVETNQDGVAAIDVSNGADISLTEDGGAPALTNPDPTGGEQFSDTTVNLSVDVTDPDFDTVTENVTLDWYIDGEHENTTSAQTNGTATYTANITSGGEHEWYVEATDVTGRTDTSGSDSNPHTFQTPGTLYIRNESDTSELIDTEDVELRFYFEDDPEPLIINRSASDGTVDMTGLPTNRPFVVVADVDGFYNRRIYKESLVDSQNVFLLNTDMEAVQPTFELTDYSGSFPEEETVMLIQRALRDPDTGTIEWRTVQGDFFGATGQFPSQLRYNERHRLVLINTETGQRLNKRQYTPTTSDLQEVVVTSSEEIVLEGIETFVSITPSTRSLPATSSASIGASIGTRTTDVTTWTVTATYENASGSETLYQETGSRGADVSATLDLANRSDGEVVVDVFYELDTGVTDTRSATFSIREDYDNQYSLLSVIGGVPTLLPSGTGGQATAFLALVFTVIGTATVSSALRPSTEAVGLIAVAFISGFWALGWMPRTVMFIAAAGWVAIAGLRRGV